MVLLITFCADRDVAILANSFSKSLFFDDYDITTLVSSLIGTPEIAGIGGNKMIKFEFLVLLELLFTDDFLDLIYSKLDLAMWAGHALDLVLINLGVDVKLEAALAYLVILSVELLNMLIVNIFVANFTCPVWLILVELIDLCLWQSNRRASSL